MTTPAAGVPDEVRPFGLSMVTHRASDHPIEAIGYDTFR